MSSSIYLEDFIETIRGYLDDSYNPPQITNHSGSEDVLIHVVSSYGIRLTHADETKGVYLHDAPAAHIEALSLASKAIKAGLVVENLSDFTTDSEIELEPEVFVVSAVYPLATFFNLQLAYAFVKHTFPQHTQQVNDQNMKVFHGPNAMHVSIHRFPEIREEEENEVACEKPNPF